MPPADMAPMGYKGLLAKGQRGFVEMYMNILSWRKGGITRVLKAVLEGKGGVLFHCNWGRDETGIVAAILLLIAGAGTELVELDWMLSRIGIEAVKAEWGWWVGRQLELPFTSQYPSRDWKHLRAYASLANTEKDCWRAFLKRVEEEFEGGLVRGYVMCELGFSGEQIWWMRKNLRGDVEKDKDEVEMEG
ncbi:hypothetical protein QBC40DRAFT_289529 [Triangularia verruculosa]|uniref:Tyrosine specific protein phosphatases domain-containing protein n=1 Tax=Triangularia verruculosa TaxID=2587418 RepID=A0AAN7AQ28_9PEZI|nr:hypothetical protein QBC40DRAFT_289529 [Triangularia verruculosa]